MGKTVEPIFKVSNKVRWEHVRLQHKHKQWPLIRGIYKSDLLKEEFQFFHHWLLQIPQHQQHWQLHLDNYTKFVKTVQLK